MLVYIVFEDNILIKVKILFPHNSEICAQNIMILQRFLTKKTCNRLSQSVSSYFAGFSAGWQQCAQDPTCVLSRAGIIGG